MRIWPLLRYEIVQSIIDATGASRYLEIGTQTAATFSRIGVDHKTGVDPDAWAQQMAEHWCAERKKQNDFSFFRMTSDAYFDAHDDKFDVIFIDGLHEREQWKVDVANAMERLNPGGVIACHDCHPPDERSQLIPPLDNGEWVGDVWKGWVDLHQQLSVRMVVVDTDFGVGIIVPDEEAAPIASIEGELTYKRLMEHKDEWLNLIPVVQFESWVQSLRSAA